MPDPQQRHHAPARAGGAEGGALRLTIAGRRAAFGLLALLVMGAVAWMSARAALRVGARDVMPSGPWGNLLHIGAFGVLAWALARAIDPQARPAGIRAPAGLAAFFVSAAYGLSDEVHQFFTPGRQCSLYDVVLDAAGAAIALLVPFAGGPGRPRSATVAAALFSTAIAIAVVTGVWRVPGDGLLEAILGCFV